MTFLDNLINEDNKTVTTNGENGYKSTLSGILDLSTEIGNSRFLNIDDLTDLMIEARDEDFLLYSKLIAYARDVRQGGGDKRLGRLGFVDIFDNININKIPFLVTLISEYGSYKDVVLLLLAPVRNKDKKRVLAQH